MAVHGREREEFCQQIGSNILCLFAEFTHNVSLIPT